MKTSTIQIPILLVGENNQETITTSSIPLENIVFWWKGLSGKGIIRLVNGDDLCSSIKFEVLDIMLDTERNKQN